MNSNIMYIYNLPHQERRELCRILDQNDKWEELGGTYMEFDVMTLQDIRRGIFRGHSPTEELLTLWGHQNHTVVELFILLSKMQHYQSMITLKPFVDSKYHRLIHEGEHNLSNLIHKLHVRNKNEPCTKDLGIAEENFNKSEKIINRPISAENRVQRLRTPEPIVQPEVNAVFVSRDDNESVEENCNGSNRNSLRETLDRLGNLSPVSETAGAVPQIPYEELEIATDNWNPRTILGKGGFGTVFKGTWKCTLVAIKRIEERPNSPESNLTQLKQSITELRCLNAYRHDNVLPLYGYSISGPRPCLVYQYMPGGCLEQRLRAHPTTRPTLSWMRRLTIMQGVARGLQFIHTIGKKPLIHGDIKSANILLDLNDEPRIGDFGLAREGPHSDYTHMTVSRIHGTRPYLPDEFLRNKNLSTKVDTYSFGVVLFEVATGLSAYSEARPHKFLKDHVLLFEGDVVLLKDSKPSADNDRFFFSLVDTGRLCVGKRARDRPEMRDVLIKLEGVN